MCRRADYGAQRGDQEPVHHRFIIKNNTVAGQRQLLREPVDGAQQRLLRRVKRVNQYEPHRIQRQKAYPQHQQGVADFEYTDAP
ncbi:hypothetical protein D3C80_1712040 [compost metagenome]